MMGYSYSSKTRVLFIKRGDIEKTFSNVSLNEVTDLIANYCWRMGWRN